MRIEITRVEPAFGGLAFGDVGTYEKIVGRATGRVDPAHPLNAGVVNLDRAPVGPDGLVDYACDFYLLKPADMRRANRRLLYDVLNRGNKVALHSLNDALRNLDGGMRIASNDPATADDAGNGFLMRRGYSILWSGWQGGGVLPGDGRMAATFPVARGTDGPIVGPGREEFVFEHAVSPVTAPLSYPSATDDPARCTLTVRQCEDDARMPIAASQWRFVAADQIEIDRPAQFDASSIYEFIYPARDPVVMGLAFAAVRDLVTFFRRERADAAGTPNPLCVDGHPAIDHALAYGMSQAGRFLRDFLYQGFNEALGGGKVFDGMMACMAGSRKSFVNRAFAQPARFSRQHEDRLFPDDQFPFTYATTTDPVSARTDGILARCEASGTCPKIIQTESSSDFFQGRSSLVAIDGSGTAVAISDSVRLYHLAGIQHGGGGDPTMDFARMFPSSAYPANRADASNVHRALLVALDRWISGDDAPPPSRFPGIGDDEPVSAAPDLYGFPAIPGAAYPGVVNRLDELDYSVQPPVPVPGRSYRVLVPALDGDGNERGGVRVPEIAVPLGTHTGWTARRNGYAPGELGAIGAYFPFAVTEKDRAAAGDPRASLELRYRDEASYVRMIANAAAELQAQGLLLEEDVDRAVQAAAERWASIAAPSQPE